MGVDKVEIAVDLALKALIVKSANDMAIMLAEKIGGSEAKFADMMTAKAKSLGMARSRFVNASGLPDARQTTSARDMALLARALIRDFPEHASLFAMPAVAIGKKKLGSHNGLLKTFAGADGMKTGFICDSGYNIVASATRSGTRLVAVVLGEPTGAARTDRTRSLLEYGFETHSWKTFLGGAATIETTCILSGCLSATAFSLARSLAALGSSPAASSSALICSLVNPTSSARPSARTLAARGTGTGSMFPGICMAAPIGVAL